MIDFINKIPFEFNVQLWKKLKIIKKVVIEHNQKYKMDKFSEQHVERYCIEFLNRLIGVENRKIEEITELKNGLHLFSVLSTIKEIQIKQLHNQQPLSFAQCLENMKSILYSIDNYWNGTLKLSWQHQIDIVNIARGNKKEINNFVLVVIKTLLLSTYKTNFIQKILQTSEQSQHFFMKLISTLQSQMPKSQENNKNSTLYLRMQQIERENEQLIKIIEEMEHQNILAKQRQKQLEQCLKQTYKQVVFLQQQIKNLKLNEFQNHQQQSFQIQRSVQFNQMEEMQTSQLQKSKQQKILENQLQQLKQIIRNQTLQLKKLPILEQQLKETKIQRQQIIKINQQLAQKNMKTNQKLQSVQNQLKFLQKTHNEDIKEIQSLRLKFIHYEKTITEKNDLIEQLENNIKYLIETDQTKSPQKQQKNHQSTEKTTLKEECQSTILTNKQHLILTKLTEQNVSLSRQLKLAQQITSKMQFELEQYVHFKEQNQKLVQMISHMQKYRGQQNQLLVKTLYQMRLKLLKSQIMSKNTNQNVRNTLKDINRNY